MTSATPQKRSLPDIRQVRDSAREAVRTQVRGRAQRKLVPREIPIIIKYSDPGTGQSRRWEGISRVMDDTDRRQTYAMMNAMAMGPWENLPPMAREQIVMLSVVATQLRDLPDWLMKALGENAMLLTWVHTEVAEHELRYFRGDAGPGETDPKRWGVEVISPFTSEPATGEPREPDDSQPGTR